ncbi:PREDICTED: FK506-binding protein 3-like [Amphimedon queenslandica]|uniref:peptidylprolyl isomerase n=1 Tax=Amphimedon queenslandica TaxID=400682 RepID=A0AAN0JGX3_AMPQE|nr:PREDICTED: FK506-binding protein 3-like [Amphimedon queenslandica]|eukprot:XP_019855903.1 PREDICTED: FK506-binding protein 3-like [Amphimedon queenslandica]
MTVYACLNTSTPYSERVSVHLTGYYCLEQSQDDESFCGEEEDELISEEESSEEEGEFSKEDFGEDISDGLFHSLPSEDDDDDDFPSLHHLSSITEVTGDDDNASYDDFDYPSIQHLSRASITEVTDQDNSESHEADPPHSASLSRKRKKTRKQDKEAGKLKKKKTIEPATEEGETEEGEEDVEIRKTKQKSKNKKRKKKTVAEPVQEDEEDSSVNVTATSSSVSSAPVSSSSVDRDSSVSLESSVALNASSGSVKQSNFKKTFSCGVEMTELKYGTGKIPKQGSLVTIIYSSSYKSPGEEVFQEFDKDTRLCFRLGRGECMPGLEKGMKGMKPGGSRRIIIPPSQRRKGDVPESIPHDCDVRIFVKLLNVK